MVRNSGIILGIFLLNLLTASAETVTRVHDGDSFHVAEFKKEVRLFGVDAPEVSSPPGVRGKHQGQPLAIESRDYLRTLILGKQVSLQCPHTKSHQRPVCKVFTGNIDIAAEMVKKGWAYDEPHFTVEYRTQENLAKQNGLGVWSLPNGGVRPWDWRRQQRKKI